MPVIKHQQLTEFLAAAERPDGTLSYHELQGFLFAIACSPEAIAPSEWMPLVFNDQDMGFAGMKEAQNVLEIIVELYNTVNARVDDGSIHLPHDISIDGAALDNIGGGTPLSQWSSGFLVGQDWLHDVWSYYTPPILDQDLDFCLVTLTYFSSRRLAEEYFTEDEELESATLSEHAAAMLGQFEAAMRDYALLGRTLGKAVEAYDNSREFAERVHRVGRNDPCPCGSGKPYRKCCLQ